MGSFRDDMCACEDKPCAERVTAALTRWGQEMAARPRSDAEPKLTEEDNRQMAEITESMTKCMTTAMLAAQSGINPIPAANHAPPNVSPQALDALRISGIKNIVPDVDTQTAMATAGRTKIVGSFKLCVDVSGAVQTVVRLKSTGFDAYDRKLDDGIRSWKYRPFLIDGTPTTVCTAVTFIYELKPPPAVVPAPAH